MEFLEILEKLRREKGITRKQLLEDCGINKNAYTYWNRGTKPNGATLDTLSAYFGVDANYLKGDIPTVLERKLIKSRPLSPVVNLDSAAKDVFTEEDIIGYVTVDEEYDSENYFWIRVTEDSMSPRIEEGDLLLIQRDGKITNNSIAVAYMKNHPDTICVTQVLIFEDTIVLHSSNPRYKDIRLKFNKYLDEEHQNIVFVGRVRKVERDL